MVQVQKTAKYIISDSGIELAKGEDVAANEEMQIASAKCRLSPEGALLDVCLKSQAVLYYPAKSGETRTIQYEANVSIPVTDVNLFNSILEDYVNRDFVSVSLKRMDSGVKDIQGTEERHDAILNRALWVFKEVWDGYKKLSPVEVFERQKRLFL